MGSLHTRETSPATRGQKVLEGQKVPGWQKCRLRGQKWVPAPRYHTWDRHGVAPGWDVAGDTWVPRCLQAGRCGCQPPWSCGDRARPPNQTGLGAAGPVAGQSPRTRDAQARGTRHAAASVACAWSCAGPTRVFYFQIPLHFLNKPTWS